MWKFYKIFTKNRDFFENFRKIFHFLCNRAFLRPQTRFFVFFNKKFTSFQNPSLFYRYKLQLSKKHKKLQKFSCFFIEKIVFQKIFMFLSPRDLKNENFTKIFMFFRKTEKSDFCVLLSQIKEKWKFTVFKNTKNRKISKNLFFVIFWKKHDFSDK